MHPTPPIELSSPDEINALLVELAQQNSGHCRSIIRVQPWVNAASAHLAAPPLGINQAPAKARTAARPLLRRGCQCGQCGLCRDNARWERIFDEKFADPAYYGHLHVRHVSTLAEAR